ncbi:hypothetical protein OAG71_04240 [bacterium]|nr:hypothetical protein [bacterium]
MATVSYLSITPYFYFPRNRQQRRFQTEMGPVAGGSLVATTYISKPGQGERTALIDDLARLSGSGRGYEWDGESERQGASRRYN